MTRIYLANQSLTWHLWTQSSTLALPRWPRRLVWERLKTYKKMDFFIEFGKQEQLEIYILCYLSRIYHLPLRLLQPLPSMYSTPLLFGSCSNLQPCTLDTPCHRFLPNANSRSQTRRSSVPAALLKGHASNSAMRSATPGRRETTTWWSWRQNLRK